ncbi:hypothetical protein C2W64_02996 [Brevibacillus laterosporus]|nr:hypothetical protein C2W64_02996 [Brevibacillus laterosporus]
MSAIQFEQLFESISFWIKAIMVFVLVISAYVLVITTCSITSIFG